MSKCHKLFTNQASKSWPVSAAKTADSRLKVLTTELQLKQREKITAKAVISLATCLVFLETHSRLREFDRGQLHDWIYLSRALDQGSRTFPHFPVAPSICSQGGINHLISRSERWHMLTLLSPGWWFVSGTRGSCSQCTGDFWAVFGDRGLVVKLKSRSHTATPAQLSYPAEHLQAVLVWLSALWGRRWLTARKQKTPG